MTGSEFVEAKEVQDLYYRISCIYPNFSEEQILRKISLRTGRSLSAIRATAISIKELEPSQSEFEQIDIDKFKNIYEQKIKDEFNVVNSKFEEKNAQLASFNSKISSAQQSAKNSDALLKVVEGKIKREWLWKAGFWIVVATLLLCSAGTLSLATFLATPISKATAGVIFGSFCSYYIFKSVHGNFSESRKKQLESIKGQKQKSLDGAKENAERREALQKEMQPIVEQRNEILAFKEKEEEALSQYDKHQYGLSQETRTFLNKFKILIDERKMENPEVCGLDVDQYREDILRYVATRNKPLSYERVKDYVDSKILSGVDVQLSGADSIQQENGDVVTNGGLKIEFERENN